LTINSEVIEMNEMTEFTILATGVGILTQVIKKALPWNDDAEDRVMPLLALFLGVAGSFLFAEVTAVHGFFAGASAVGIYSGGKKALNL